nr:MAG TPA: organic radical activating enzyme [Caudoviricetes sp.]
MEIKVKNIDVTPKRVRPLPIVEIFGDTIQGEGPLLGPAVFVRTGMCNLKCEGFGCTRIAPNGETVVGCDTIHAVSPKFKSTWTEYTKATDLIDAINKVGDPMLERYREFGTNTKFQVVLTGGEPTMHWDNEVLQTTLKYFHDRGFHITVETNASRNIEFTEDYQRALQFSMSVKLSVSGEPERKRLNFDAINNIIENSTGSYFKFVVNPETWDETSKEILNILNSTESANTQVYLMPLGETIEKQLKNTRFVFDVCAKYGFSFTPRAHILAYNDLDGV